MPSSTEKSPSKKTKTWNSPYLEARLRRRRCHRFLLVILVIVTILCGIGALVQYVRPDVKRTELVQMFIGPKPLPPLYHDVRKAERRLPQHWTKPFARGEKYLWVASHGCCSGWANVMQDMILTAHLTYLSGRGYVFDDYNWVRGGPAYSEWNGKLIAAHTPLSAIISGPLVGEQWANNDPTPLSISKERFKKICPKPFILDGERIRAVHGEGASAQRIVETWLKVLEDIDDPCVEVPLWSGSIFHPFSFGNKDEMLPVWPALSKSPVLATFGWSALAHSAVKRNQALIDPPTVFDHAQPFMQHPNKQIDGLLAIHIRRGDFIEHCDNLCHWNAAFLAFNDYPDSLDPWEFPQGDDDQRMTVYRRRCIPSIAQIVDKIEQVRRTNAAWGLRNVYIMTNGKPRWVTDLKKPLRAAYQWDSITSSRDMVLTWTEKHVSYTADMLIGQRAQVFIGNGFSSVSSSVAVLRRVHGFSSNSTRMW